MKNTLLAMTNSLFMASCQNPNMSQSPRGNQLQKWTFSEEAGVVKNPQNAAKIDPNTFFFMKNTLSARTNDLFMASCQNPNISESPRWN